MHISGYKGQEWVISECKQKLLASCWFMRTFLFHIGKWTTQSPDSDIDSYSRLHQYFGRISVQKSYVFKGHVPNVNLYLCHCIYLFYSIHDHCVYSLTLWTFKLFHEPQKRVSVLAKWQKPFFSQKLFWLLSLGLWNIVSLQDLFPPSGLRNLLLKFTLMGRNGRPRWTQISSPKPQRSY